MVDGQTVYYGGSNRGITAVKLRSKGGGLAGETLWKNDENSVQSNTPVVKDGHLYALASNNDLFCIETAGGKTTWKMALNPDSGEGGDAARGGGDRPGNRGGEGRPREGIASRVLTARVVSGAKTAVADARGEAAAAVADTVRSSMLEKCSSCSRRPGNSSPSSLGATPTVRSRGSKSPSPGPTPIRLSPGTE